MYYLFCVVLCIVCVYMCTVLLPPGGNPIAVNPLNAELNPICHLLALLGVHYFLRVSRIRVKSLSLTLLMSYIYIYIYISSLRVKYIVSYVGVPTTWINRQEQNTHLPTAATNVITPYGPNVDGLFPKAYVNILGAKIFPLVDLEQNCRRNQDFFRRKWR